MKALEALLGEIVKQTSFEIGHVRFIDGGSYVIFDEGAEKTISPAQLRTMLNDTAWHAEGRVQAESSRLLVPDHLIANLVEYLRELLGDHLTTDDDRICLKFPVDGTRHICQIGETNGMHRREYEPELPDLARGIIRGTALLGPKRVAEFLSDWIAGKPLQYRYFALLVGVTVDDELDLHNGVRVVPLPTSSDSLPVSLPRTRSIQTTDYLGRAMLSVDINVRPVFSRIGEERNFDRHDSVLSIPEISSLDSLYEALSLVTDSSVRSNSNWYDFGIINTFSGDHSRDGSFRPPDDNPSSLAWSTSPETGLVRLMHRQPAPHNLSLKELQKAWDLHGKLHNRSTKNRRFRNAIRRWARCTRNDLDATDQFIELRIALEALYLDSSPGEQTFRLSSRGAWHLGHSHSERIEIQQTLRKFYRIASKVVHGDEPNEDKGDFESLRKAKDICRRGILKALRQSGDIDFDGLVMGYETGTQGQ